MATFIKAGFWEKLCQKCTGYKGWLNLDQFVEERAGGLPYKVYTALLNQSGTDAPVATILQNTLDGTPVWTRISAGIYHCTLTDAFPKNKTFCNVTYGANNGIAPLIPQFGYYITSDINSILELYFYDPAGGVIDPNNNPCNDICIEIKVYP
jgi:hypothetical protein